MQFNDEMPSVRTEEILQNEKHVALVRDFLNVFYENKQMKAFVHTYGCQQNNADSEKIKGMLINMGYTLTDDKSEADIILFNTCAVRENAENRVFGNVGLLKALKEKNPRLIIALCGCMMQQEHIVERLKKSFSYVSLIFGTHVIHKFPELLYKCLSTQKRVFDINDELHDIVEGMPLKRDGKYKAYIPIMYGCNNFCSYCIVPYVRGREKSRSSAEIIREFRSLVSEGYKDIMLLGQNVNSYGREPADLSFSKLLRELDAIDGDFVIRFMTSHPKDCSRELIDTIAQSKKVSRHLHLPFQSGSNRILKEMNRGYSRENYLEIIDYAKQKIDGLSLSTDVIVGFPGENYEDFLDTVSLIKDVEFSTMFTFIFSKRSGTKAADMPDPIPGETKTKWFMELLAEQEKITLKNAEKQYGSSCRILVEGRSEDGFLQGRNSQNILVIFDGDDSLTGQFINVRITGGSIYKLTGEVI